MTHSQTPTTSIRASLAVLLLATALVSPSVAFAQRDIRQVESSSGPLNVATIATGLENPWALAFLPDGRMLVTERPGRLRVVTPQGEVSKPVSGVPQVFARGQGGLLDVVLAPDFAQSRMVYLSFAEPGESNRAGTAVARGRLNDAATALESTQVIFRQEPKVDGGNHFGSRLVFSTDGKLFVTMADRFKFDPAQDLGSHIGKIARLNADGSVPDDNPFVGRSGAKREIWSYGHRNIQSAALDPQSGALFVAEMGPAGGDELNRAEAGRNYGWPLVSWGKHYDGRDIPDPPTRPDFAGSVHQWTPVIAPSGMTIYNGGMFPKWRGSVLIGGLRAQGVVRVTLDGDKFGAEERIALGVRVRDVRQAPDGSIYTVTDGPQGQILRLSIKD
ncbi:MAG: glucose sorbosone dehydrogenase [Hyphomicrobiales bacterium]|nr:glucose sorbosone dehydrogenase [Hyphomicrobiales bacterium]